MLSGWNCTPCTGSVLCARPMIRPSSVSAVTASASGMVSRVDHQRMIARRLERPVDAAEHAVRPRGGSRRACRASAPARARPCRRTPGRSPDGRGRRRGSGCVGAALLDQVEADAGLVRRAGAGRQHDRLGLAREHVVDRDLVVAMHDDVRPQLAQVVDEVEGEAVVVVDQQDHGRLSSSTFRALRRGSEPVRAADGAIARARPRWRSGAPPRRRGTAPWPC